MSNKPITYVHYFLHDQTAMISRSPICTPASDEVKRTYHHVTPSSADRLVAVLRALIDPGGCDILLGTGYSPHTLKPDTFFTDWMVFTPAWDSNRRLT